MLIGAERFSRHHGYVSISQQSLGKLHRIGDSVLAQRRSNIRIGIECALGFGAMDAGNGPQPRDHEVAPLAIFGQHTLHRILRAAHRFDRRFLSDRSRIGGGVALQFHHGADERRGRQAKSNAPARHGVSFRHRAGHKHRILRTRNRGDRERRAFI